MGERRRYRVVTGKRVQKALRRLPWRIAERFHALVGDLKTNGPVAGYWPIFSKLRDNEYHCHLSRKWIACWRHDKETITIEVHYVGSRENAPY